MFIHTDRWEEHVDRDLLATRSSNRGEQHGIWEPCRRDTHYGDYSPTAYDGSLYGTDRGGGERGGEGGRESKRKREGPREQRDREIRKEIGIET